MRYIQYYTLECRDAINPLPSREVDGTLLVGELSVLQFTDNHSQYGNDNVSIFPCFFNGVQGWLVREEWEPAYGYSASGTEEHIISLEDGIKILVSRGVFNLNADVEKAGFHE